MHSIVTRLLLPTVIEWKITLDCYSLECDFIQEC